MQRVQLTFYAPDTVVHPLHTTITEREYVESARMVHWNVAGETLTHAFHVAGDSDAFAADLGAIPEVLEYDLAQIASDRFYAYVRAETTPVQRAMFDAYDGERVVVTSALEHTDDGGVTFTAVGDPTALQSAIDAAPEGLRIEIERVGGAGTAEPEAALGALTDRQREAAEVAVEAGYYDVPRTASHDDVAAALGCAPSTASEHLRKAESKLLRALFA